MNEEVILHEDRQWYGTLLSDKELLELDSSIDNGENEWFDMGESYEL